MAESRTADLLVELGCEELPPKALAELAEAFHDGVVSGLEAADVAFDAQASAFYYTPRRMTLCLSAVADRQPDRRQERRGPSVQAAFDTDGNPTKAATGFAASVGQEVDRLDRLKTDKGEWLACSFDIPGKPLFELIYPILQDALDRLPVPKPMRWSDHAFSFVRPVHWLVVLHGDSVIDGELYGCRAGRQTRGHRIHAPGPHDVSSPAEYPGVLESAFVMVDHRKRRELICDSAVALGRELGGIARVTEELLDEVRNLVEWPVAVAGQFEAEFLEVPQEALVASLESHQKMFPVLASDGGELTRHFIIIANLESRAPDEMIAGFERVVRPRLADARFFWEQDLKTPLADRLEALDRIVFQEKLGSIGDKSRRMASTAGRMAELMGAEPAPAERGALLAKGDLVTLMVGEFPELQGVMGEHYARADGEPGAVAAAIGEHYGPRFAGDRIPASAAGQAIALADRLDSLVGIFAAGQKPTGNRDPFALRRAALSVVRILTEADIAVDLDTLLALSAEALAGQIDADAAVIADVRAFIVDRLRHHWIDQGATARQMSAVLAAPLGTLPDLRARLDAVAAFMRQPEAESLVAANKRIGNILKKQDGGVSSKIDEKLMVLDEERQLFEEVSSATSELAGLYEQRDYKGALSRLSQLRSPVDAYFDAVMVMDEDPKVRANRLAQLHRLKSLFDRVADFTQAD